MNITASRVLARRQAWKRARRHWQLYLFLLLPVAYLILFSYVPMVGAQIAFRDYSPVRGIWGSAWAGLKYFEKFIDSYQFERVLTNTLRVSLYSILAGFPVPLALAVMLNCVRSVRWKKVSQNILYLPHFISTVVMVGMLLQMINPVTGLYAHIHSLLYGSLPSDLMANPSAFAHLYVWSGIWQHMGWDSVIYLAALTAVDPELHEAACIDGASRLGRVWHVDLPGILPTVVILLIMRCGSVMSVGFEKVYLMQTDLNLRASELISTYVYKVGLTSVGTGMQFSYATAIGLFNSVINLIILALVNAISRRLSATSLW